MGEKAIVWPFVWHLYSALSGCTYFDPEIHSNLEWITRDKHHCTKFMKGPWTYGCVATHNVHILLGNLLILFSRLWYWVFMIKYELPTEFAHAYQSLILGTDESNGAVFNKEQSDLFCRWADIKLKGNFCSVKDVRSRSIRVGIVLLWNWHPLFAIML